ncbi:MAG: hypothetical protein ACI9M1_002546 [Porticoccaceae bacterium]|jgi:uncharacterized protein YbjT (DUF2867 family)
MDTEKQNILIAGANGTTGRIIINLLKETESYKPIAMVRSQEQKKYFEEKQVSAVIADLEKDVSYAVKKIDKVIFAAGSKNKNVIGVDQEGAKRLIDAAKNAAVKKFVMLSSMGTDNPSIGGELEDYFKAKQNADDYLKNSGLIYSIVKPGALTNEKSTGKIELNEKLNKKGSISRADVAQTLVEVLEDNLKKNQAFEIITGDTRIKNAVTNY